MVCNTSTHYKKTRLLKTELLVCIAIKTSDPPFILLSTTPQCDITLLQIHTYYNLMQIRIVESSISNV